MKSVVLLIWLLTAGGKEHLVVNRHVDDMTTCNTMAQSLVVDYTRQNQKVRTLCHEVVEEVGDVDENGNPVTHTTTANGSAGR